MGAKAAHTKTSNLGFALHSHYTAAQHLRIIQGDDTATEVGRVLFKKIPYFQVMPDDLASHNTRLGLSTAPNT